VLKAAMSVSTRNNHLSSWFVVAGAGMCNGSIINSYCYQLENLPYQSSRTMRIDGVPFSDDLKFQIQTNPAADVAYTWYSDLDPTKTFETKDVIRRNIYVYIFEGAPLESTARAHVEAAVGIWRNAGVDFKPVYRNIGGEDLKSILGDDKKLTVFYGEADRDSGEWQDRQRVQGLKPNKDSFAVVFARTTFMGFGGTRADPERNQTYIDEDVQNAPPGRTVAHELGHLLLGEGHTGQSGVPWTSGLMYAGTNSSAVDLTDTDSNTARGRARTVPSP